MFSRMAAIGSEFDKHQGGTKSQEIFRKLIDWVVDHLMEPKENTKEQKGNRNRL